MAAAAIQKSIVGLGTESFEKKKRLTWGQFQKQYLIREDFFKYEWVRGAVEKTPRTMYQDQVFIAYNLIDFFDSLRFQKRAAGRLSLEVDTFFLKDVHRRPDLAYFSGHQLVRMARKENQVPEFVVEIISSKDQMNLVHEKMQNYRDADVKVVWHIFPNLQEVHVYKGYSMTICKGDAVCSAAPVLPEFEMRAWEVFKAPVGD